MRLIAQPRYYWRFSTRCVVLRTLIRRFGQFVMCLLVGQIPASHFPPCSLRSLSRATGAVDQNSRHLEISKAARQDSDCAAAGIIVEVYDGQFPSQYKVEATAVRIISALRIQPPNNNNISSFSYRLFSFTISLNTICPPSK